jgi:integrase
MSWWLYKKANSSKWTAKIQVPGKPAFRRTTGTSNRRTAERVAEKLEREALVQGAPTTLYAALEGLIAVQTDKGDSHHTIAITERCGSHLCTFFGRFREVQSIGLDDTTKYMRKRRAYVHDPTIYRELRVLREALVQLKRRGLYRDDPAALWPTGLAQSFPGKSRWLTPDEWRRLYMALNSRWRDHLVVYTWSGVRLSELFALRPEHADFVNRKLFAPGTKTESAARWVPMHGEVAAVLKRRLRKGEAFFPLEAPSENQDAYSATRSRFYKALKMAAAKAGIERLSANDLRRTFCSWCYQAGVTSDDCARWLGHKNSKMVRDVYGHDSPENAARKLDAVPNLLGNARDREERAADDK